MLKAVIFDLDGVIADSMQLHFEAEKKTLLKYGISATTEELAAHTGNKVIIKFSAMLEKYKVKANPEDILKIHMAESYEYIKKNVAPVNGVLNLINDLRGERIKLAVASGSPRIFVDFILKKFNMAHLFGVVVTADDVTNAKPSPEIFLQAAKKLKHKPEDCVVIEDAPNGIRAATLAGMKCVAITTTHKRKEIEEADKVISAFNELSVDSISELFKKERA